MERLPLTGLTIGTCRLPYGLMLAPMAGVTDRAFRQICLSCGAEYTVSEMVSAKALCYEQRCRRKDAREASRTAPLAAVYAEDGPMAVQLFGHEPDYLAEAAALLTAGAYYGCRSTARPAAIDINMGCPVPKVVGNGEGSALMRDPALAGRLVEAVVKATDLPVTVKMRAGWDEDSRNAPEVARAVEAAGAAAIVVHGRTRRQMYAPGVDYGIIGAVKQAVSVPVIGNGDVYTVADARRMLAVSGCDGVMVARGALGNPWLFSELQRACRGEAAAEPLPLAERMAVALRQVRLMIDDKGEDVAIREARKQVAWYVHGVEGAAAARMAIHAATTLTELEAIVARLIDGNDM